MSIHRIRLLGPWEAEVWSITTNGGIREWNGKITPPCPFPEDEVCDVGTICLNRIFHPPTNFTAQTELYLVLPGIRDVVGVSINASGFIPRSDSGDDWRGKITHPLHTNNELAIICQWDTAEGITLPQLFQGAILEIHEGAA